MRKATVSKIIAGLGAAAVVGLAGTADAFEVAAPYQPGISIGAPAGALPPPGFYFLDDNVIITGPVKNHSGGNLAGPAGVGGNVNVYNNNPTIIWSPNLQLLGAQYSVAVTEPYVMQTIDIRGAFGPTAVATSNGVFNTVLSPLNLSWNLGNGLFAKFGTAVYIPDATYSDHAVVGGRVSDLKSIGNNFWTIEPDIGVSWLSDGWNVTGHLIFDINTNNTSTNYQSGTAAYFDGTVAKTFGKFTAGAGFNYSEQINGDSGSGAVLALANGKRLRYGNAGPLFAYEVGPVTFSGKLLFGYTAKDTAQANFYHFDVFFPF